MLSLTPAASEARGVLQTRGRYETMECEHLTQANIKTQEHIAAYDKHHTRSEIV